MGTALEMWVANQRGIPILTISPKAEDWVVKSLSEKVFPRLSGLAEFIAHSGWKRQATLNRREN